MYVLDLEVDDNLLYRLRSKSLRDIIYFGRSLVRKYGRNEYSGIFAYIYESETNHIDYVIAAIFADKHYSMLRCSDDKLIVIRDEYYG